MRCRRCNKLLWVRESVKRGVGPICHQHIFEDRAIKLLTIALRKYGKEMPK